MRILTKILLWLAVFAIAFTVNLFFRNLCDGMEIGKIARAVIMGGPTGLCIGAGIYLQDKLKTYFNNKPNTKNKA